MVSTSDLLKIDFVVVIGPCGCLSNVCLCFFIKYSMLPAKQYTKEKLRLTQSKNIFDWLRYLDQVSSFKRLRGGVTFITEIPKLPSGKILRMKLKSMDQASSINSKPKVVSKL